MGGGGYDVMLELALFLGAGWFLGRAFRSWGAPAILAEILVGVVLGPELLNVVPYAKSGQCAADHNPSILVLIGNMGVALMIFESGMHLHFDKVAEVGKDAFIVACIGTLTPIVLGIGTGVALGYNIFPDCLSLGIALAPTSVGIALNLLNDAKFLNSTPGRIIITAALNVGVRVLQVINRHRAVLCCFGPHEGVRSVGEPVYYANAFPGHISFPGSNSCNLIFLFVLLSI